MTWPPSNTLPQQKLRPRVFESRPKFQFEMLSSRKLFFENQFLHFFPKLVINNLVDVVENRSLIFWCLTVVNSLLVKKSSRADKNLKRLTIASLNNQTVEVFSSWKHYSSWLTTVLLICPNLNHVLIWVCFWNLEVLNKGHDRWLIKLDQD